jgi:putative ABC transport system permease protein
MRQRLEELRLDGRFAFRQLRQAPGFTIVAVLTLALGIGANSAMFALADAVLLRPLPYGEPDRLVMLWDTQPSSARNTITPLDFVDWTERTRTFDALAAVVQNGATMIGADGVPEMVPNQSVTPAFFDVLGVGPIAGRTFRADDVRELPGAVVLSERFWKERFGGDPAVIGQRIRIGAAAQPRTIVGIVSADVQILGRSDFWDLLPDFRANVKERRLHLLQVLGRVKRGVTVEQAQADMSSIASTLSREYPASNTGHGVRVERLRAAIVGPELRLTALLFLGVVGFVLLMCCANVATLVLARVSARSRELALRSSLGAGRLRIVMQLLTESVLLSALGGAVALGVGAAVLRAAPLVIPRDLLPAAMTLTFDARVVTFCAVATFLVGVLFGLGPAWQVTRSSLVEALASDSRATTARGGRLRGALVGGQIACAVLLLCGAGLLLRTLLALDSVDAGFRAERVLTMSVNIPGAAPNLRYWTPESRWRFFDAVEREVRALPGVRSVGWGTSLPLDGPGVIGSMSFDIPGRATPMTEEQAYYQIVSSTYFQTLDIPLVAGRSFSAGDTADSRPVAIVNEAFVRRYLSGEDPLRTRIAVRPMMFGPAQPIGREIVGVVRQVATFPHELDAAPQIYVPLAQNPWIVSRLVVQPASGDPAALLSSVRAAIARVDRDRAVTLVRTMTDVSRQATARHRVRALLVVTFAALALVLAMVGVFGVLAHAVQQRTRELGVRIALGARVSDVLRLVLASAGRMLGIGAVAGLAAAMIAARSIATLLFGVRPLDPVTFAGAVLLLTAAGVLATAAPAWRAAHVDPAVAFRND